MDSPPPSKRYKVRNHLTTNNDRELHKKQTWKQGNGNKTFDLDMKCILSNNPSKITTDDIANILQYIVSYCIKGDALKKKPLPKYLTK